MKSRKSKRLSVVALAIVSLLAVGCSKDDSSVSSSSSSNTDNSATSETKPEVVLNVSDAVDIAKLGEEKEYTVRGEIKSFQSYYYGQLTLTDGTNDLSVYGCYALAADGSSIYFDDMDYIPVVGDTITVKGILKTYQGEAELGKSVIKKIEQGEHKPVDTTGYSKNSYILFQYATEDGKWIDAIDFNLDTLSKNKDELDSFSYSFNSDVRKIRFLVHTNQVNYEKNKGRVVIGDITVTCAK